MKKSSAILLIAWLTLSVLLFTLIAFIFIPILNQYEENMQILYQRQKIIESDFEQVYLQEDYEITPTDNGIAIKLTENSAQLICYYNINKEFVKFEIDGAPVFTDEIALIVVWILFGVLAVIGSLAIIGAFVGIMVAVSKPKDKQSVKIS